MKRAHFGQAPSTLPTWLIKVECKGDEERLSDCRRNTWGDGNCGHSEDAGVICYTSKYFSSISSKNVVHHHLFDFTSFLTAQVVSR